jgi:GalNAc5-diNAcBac-PP-undecaprenol beta-1,3-glucosyltransferase
MSRDISICLCSTLSNNYIYATVESILKQKCRISELIIITPVLSHSKIEIIAELRCRAAEVVPSCRFIHKETFRNGLSHARNVGVKTSSSSIILFADDDDIWRDDKAYKTVLVLMNQQQPTLVRHLFQKFNHNGPLTTSNNYCRDIDGMWATFANHFGGGSTLAGNKVIFEALPFNEALSMCEDWEFWLRATFAHIPIITIFEPLVDYRVHKERMTSSFLKNFNVETSIRIITSLRLACFITGFIIGLLKSAAVVALRLVISLAEIRGYKLRSLAPQKTNNE